MRLYEIQGFAHLDEDILTEAWLDSVKKSLGNKVEQTVTVVKNTTAALQMFYKIGTDKEYLETTTFLLKKDIKAKLKQLGNGPVMSKIKPIVEKLFPSGRGIMDFVQACILCAVVKFILSIQEKYNSAKKVGKELAGGAKDKAQEILSDLVAKMTGLDQMIDRLSQASGVFAILETLGIANDLLFETLTNIGKKIANPFA